MNASSRTNRNRGLAVIAAVLLPLLAGCASPEAAPQPSGPTIADKAQAIQNDRTLSPTQKAIAVNQLENDEVKKALAGQSSIH